MLVVIQRRIKDLDLQFYRIPFHVAVIRNTASSSVKAKIDCEEMHSL